MIKGYGRPLKFNDPEKLQKDIERYFSEYDKEVEQDKTFRQPPTVTGLAEALGTSRKVLCDYESGKYDKSNKEFSYIIKRAKTEIQKRWLRFAQELKSQRKTDHIELLQIPEKSVYAN